MMARPISELVSPKSANVRKMGVSSAWYGMIKARSSRTNSGSLNGTGKRASPYPARIVRPSVNSTVSSAVPKLLSR